MASPFTDRLFLDLQEVLAGRYSLDTELGRGGMGVVYLARDVRLDRPVALKVLPDDLARRPNVRARFLREARTAAKLSHPNIVPIHSVDEVDRFVFFVMSYISGETLGERVRRRGPVAPTECMRILRDVGFALSYAHGQGVVHRDIKPDNILLEEGSGRALVADFGIAGRLDGNDPTVAGEIIGTAEFMSPEQAMGAGVDARSDIYSIGMVALYALSAELPFPREEVRETIALVRDGPQLSVATFAQSAPRRLVRIADRCLKRDQSERFQTADQLAEAIETVAATRRRMPVAVRNFLYDPVDLGGDAPAYFSVAALMTLPMLMMVFLVPEAGGLMLTAFTLYFLGAPALLIPPRIRRLLRSGNTLADLEVGLKQDLEQQREEAPAVCRTRADRIRRMMTRFGVIGAAGSWVALWALAFANLVLGVVIPTATPFGVLVTAILGSGGIALLGRLGGDREAHQAALTKAERRLKFWGGRVGRWLFRVCGWRLNRPATEIRATHRPTELHIGLAAEALYEALSKELKASVGDVPTMVSRLEADATRLRSSIETLNEAEAHGVPHNLHLPVDLRQVREDAEQQLADVVAALETIRLGLLRLRAGSGTVEGLTTNLDAAGQIGQHVSRILGGLAEVEAALVSSGEYDPQPGY